MKSVAFLILCALMFVGCSTTTSSSYRAPDTNLRASKDGILGLPLVVANCSLSPETRIGIENQIDVEMQKAFGSRYKPIASVRKNYGPLAEAISAAIGPPCPTALQAEMQRTNLVALATESKCRYALLPRFTGYEVVTQRYLDLGWIIPLGPIIVFGDSPIRIGSNHKQQMPIHTVCLVDLNNARILAEEGDAVKMEVSSTSSTCFETPIQHLKGH